MLEPWAFIIVALAAFRITRFFVLDSLIGANVDSNSKFAMKLDAWAFDAHGEERGWLRGKVADLLTCTYCLGFWVTVATYAAWLADFRYARTVIYVFAVAGVQAFLNHLDRR